MGLNTTEVCATFHPEEAGIMLDRLAIELLHAEAKNPRAVPELKEEAEQLLACVRAWLAKTFEADGAPFAAEHVAPGAEPRALAQTLRGLAEQLLFWAEIAEARRSKDG
jgi:hypothetical protein